jgi:hypothetical protein
MCHEYQIEQTINKHKCFQQKELKHTCHDLELLDIMERITVPENDEWVLLRPLK